LERTFFMLTGMFDPRWVERVDPNKLHFVFGAAFVVTISLYLLGVVTIPTWLVVVIAVSLGSSILHLVRMEVDEGYRAKRQAKAAEWKTNQLAGKSNLSRRQAEVVVLARLPWAEVCFSCAWQRALRLRPSP
jgi:hypothetical protein